MDTMMMTKRRRKESARSNTSATWTRTRRTLRTLKTGSVANLPAQAMRMKMTKMKRWLTRKMRMMPSLTSEYVTALAKLLELTFPQLL